MFARAVTLLGAISTISAPWLLTVTAASSDGMRRPEVTLGLAATWGGELVAAGAGPLLEFECPKVKTIMATARKFVCKVVEPQRILWSVATSFAQVSKRARGAMGREMPPPKATAGPLELPRFRRRTRLDHPCQRVCGRKTCCAQNEGQMPENRRIHSLHPLHRFF
jgi:hypothetical protein